MRSASVILIAFLLIAILLIAFGVFLFTKKPEVSESELVNDWFGVSESFIVPASKYVTREKTLVGGTLEITFEVNKGGHIKFLALNESNYLKWIDGQTVENPFPLPQNPVFSLIEINFFVSNGKWFFVWDNSYDFTTEKEITALIRYPGHILDR